MKTIFIMLDSLNRHFLPLYGNPWVQAPNISRLAQRGTTFDNHWVGSLPCMPARREIFTGRHCFFEAPWGPLEPFDDCLPAELRQQKKGYSHLITDHYHYFEMPAPNYYPLFDTWEFLRGQEGDAWHPMVKDPPIPNYKGRNRRQDWVNRRFMDLERDEDYPTPQCFLQAMRFLDLNHDQDNWHLHLECFDPHEPFLCPSKYRALYKDTWDNRYHFDWPHYKKVEEEPEAVEHIRKCYAGTLTMADTWLGKLLDKLDHYGLWRDTTVVLTTDHGHMLGEHGYWAKNHQFDYRELAQIPLVVCTPEAAQAGRRVQALTATVDLMPTFMELHGAALPGPVHGRSLRHLFAHDEPHHDAVPYGYFAKDINITDGRYTYTRQPRPNSVAYHYTALPLSHWHRRELLAKAEMGRFLKQARGIPVYRIPVPSHWHRDHPEGDLLYDLQADPHQEHPLHDPELERRLAAKMAELMRRCDAPESEFVRVGLDPRMNAEDRE